MNPRQLLWVPLGSWAEGLACWALVGVRAAALALPRACLLGSACAQSPCGTAYQRYFSWQIMESGSHPQCDYPYLVFQPALAFSLHNLQRAKNPHRTSPSQHY